jgi:hypothetical protein
MSKKASISKQGGPVTEASNDVAIQSQGHPAATLSPTGLDHFAPFDALLPSGGSGAQSGVRTGSPVANSSLAGCSPSGPLAAPQGSASAVSQAMGGSNSGEFLSQDTPGSPTQWIEWLRDWESQLRQLEIELKCKAEDLNARRRAFARELRSCQRMSKRAGQPVAATDGLDLNGDSMDGRLAEMQSQIELLVSLLREAWPGVNAESAMVAEGDDWVDGLDRRSASFGFQGGVEQRSDEVDALRSQVESLVEQNNQLATELAHLAVQRTVDQSSDATASMSWEERKESLFRQFEAESEGVPFDPEMLTSEQCSRLNHEMACMQRELMSRDKEIAELRELLEQRPSVSEGGLAVGATAVTRMFDDDELIQEERLRLKDIQAEWEAKFRDMEIAASLERASLARERRELERKNSELEEQLAHLKQDLRQESIAGPAQSRRWFVKLGLGE